jgi:hypothetical protein
MKQAANAFNSRTLPSHVGVILSPAIAAPLTAVARTFVHLQEERHKADYDVSDTFDRSRVQGLIKEAEQLFADWDSIRDSDDARVFLSALIFWKLWSK